MDQGRSPKEKPQFGDSVVSEPKTRILEFKLTIEYGGEGDTDYARVEDLIALSFQDLLYDEAFTSALQPEGFISSRVTFLPKPPENG